MSGLNAVRASGTKRNSFSRLMMTSALVAAGTLGVTGQALASGLPTGESLVRGAATFDRSVADTLNINQTSERLVINWSSFDIDAGKTVEFFQPDSPRSLAVNRVLNGNAFTQINGTLKANQRVMILDPNGVIFGAGSIVDVGSIIASTGDVNNDQIASGTQIIQLNNIGDAGSVINNGTITAHNSGLTALVAHNVENSGVIKATLGKVALAAGNTTATLDLYGDGLVELAVQDNPGKTKVKNLGTVKGSTVLMTASSAKSVVDGIVNTSGVVNASSAKVVGGKIILSADKVKLAKHSVIKGDTDITAETVKLGTTIKGTVTGSAGTVYVTNDTAKIMQAMDIIDENGLVDVAAGTYNEDVVINTAGVTLRGAKSGVAGYDASRGTDETIITPHSPGVVVAANNVVVDGLTIDGANNGIEVGAYSGAVLQNNLIKNSAIEAGSGYTTNNGIYLTGSSNTSILNNYILNTGDDYNPGSDPTLNDHGSGIRADSAHDITIDGNKIENAIWDGIKIEDGYNYTVTNNDIDTVGRVGIYGSNPHNVLTSGNTVKNTGMYGIRFIGGSNDTISKNTVDHTNLEGISVHFVKGIKNILSNIVNNTAKSGIDVLNSAGTRISGNEIGLLGGANNIQGDGVYISGSDFSNVNSNKISNTKSTAFDIGSGIHIYKSSNAGASNNTITNAEWDGVKVTTGSNVSVTGNNIDHVARVGVYGMGTGGMTASSNVINDAGIYGVAMDYAGTFIDASYNTITNIVRDGINIFSSSGTKTIIGNNIDSTGENGIQTISSGNATISGNFIGTHNGAGNIKENGISVEDSANNTIKSNIVKNTVLHGIAATGTSSPLTISANNVEKTGENGIYVANASGTKNILNNVINNTGDHGINVLNSAGVMISENKIGLLGGANNIQGDGVYVSTSESAQVNSNTISNTKSTAFDIGSGIHIYKSSNAGASNNTITNAEWDGVKVTAGSNVSVTGNNIDHVARVGVYGMGTGGMTASSNVINDAGIYGVAMDYAGTFIDASYNTITNIVRDGINIYSSSGTKTIIGNNIDSTGENGIRTISSGNATISGNFIGTHNGANNIGTNGISVENSANNLIASNTVDNTTENGVYLYGAYNNATVENNDIANAGYNGIEAAYSDYINLLIQGNTIDNSYENGIYLHDLDGDIQVIGGNQIYNSGNDGIYAENINNGYFYKMALALLSEEEPTDPDYPTNPGRQLIIDSNDIDMSSYDGIELYNVGGLARISRNTITNSGYNGVHVYNDDYYFYGPSDISSEQVFFREYPYSAPINLYIVDNTIENSGFSSTPDSEVSAITLNSESYNGYAAINLNIGSEGYAKIAGNTMGSNFIYGLIGYSGNIDLTGRTNTIHDTTIGMGFYPTKGKPTFETAEEETNYLNYLASLLHLVNDTIGTTAFVDQTDFFVDLGYGAFFAPGTPTILDGQHATYTLGSATIAPSTKPLLTIGEYTTLENMLYHYVDEQDRGLFFFNVESPETASIDQKDLFRNFLFSLPDNQGGNLLITGLPSVGGGNPGGGAPLPFNLNDISPAAGDEEGGDQQNVAAIEPAAGGNADNASCWLDATQSLGQGTPVSFDFGANANSLLQDTANCGNGQEL